MELGRPWSPMGPRERGTAWASHGSLGPQHGTGDLSKWPSEQGKNCASLGARAAKLSQAKLGPDQAITSGQRLPWWSAVAYRAR